MAIPEKYVANGLSVRSQRLIQNSGETMATTEAV